MMILYLLVSLVYATLVLTFYDWLIYQFIDSLTTFHIPAIIRRHAIIIQCTCKG